MNINKDFAQRSEDDCSLQRTEILELRSPCQHPGIRTPTDLIENDKLPTNTKADSSQDLRSKWNREPRDDEEL